MSGSVSAVNKNKAEDIKSDGIVGGVLSVG